MKYRNEILEELWEARKQIEKENNNNDEEVFRKYYSRQLERPSDYFKGAPVKYRKTIAA